MTDHPEHTAFLTSAPSETEGSIVVAALAENDIHASISGEHTSGLRAGPWGWVQILVSEEDLPRAREVLEHVKQENAHIDWSHLDVGEPEE